MNRNKKRPLTCKQVYYKWIRKGFLVGIVLLAAVSLVYAQGRVVISGTVADSTGAPIQEAQIEFRASNGVAITSSNEKGFFQMKVGEAAGTLLVNFPGFTPFSREIKPGTSAENLQIRLSPAADLQRIQVTGNVGDRIPAVPSSQYELSSQAIEISGSLALDDVLRQVPGFSTFRRSSSLFANPTSQGVSLRGVGASATSRSNVLLDGIPLNDPFGGWVYWARLPRMAIESVQVVNGSASDVYGGGALGGVVNLRTHSAEEAYARGEVSYGSMNTPDFSFAAGTPIGKWSINAAGQAYQTDGYVAVPPDQRGAVDTNVGSEALTGFLEGSRTIGERGRFFIRGSGFGESAQNGTPLQNDDTTIPELDLGADWNSTMAGSFSGRVYGLREIYHQTFSSIAPDRSTESLTNVQKNPSQEIGFVGTWSRLFAEKHKVSGGFEGLDTRGHSAETNYHLGAETALVDAGGRQHSFGFFAQDAYFFAPQWLLTFRWRACGHVEQQ